jgi:hypothetical protein
MNRLGIMNNDLPRTLWKQNNVWTGQPKSGVTQYWSGLSEFRKTCIEVMSNNDKNTYACRFVQLSDNQLMRLEESILTT